MRTWALHFLMALGLLGATGPNVGAAIDPFDELDEWGMPLHEHSIWPPVLALIVLGGLILVVILLLRRNNAFVIRIRGGVPTVKRGKVAQLILTELATLCADNRIDKGKIRGIRFHRRTMLVFSRDIPVGHRQRIRNLWALH